MAHDPYSHAKTTLAPLTAPAVCPESTCGGAGILEKTRLRDVVYSGQESVDEKNTMTTTPRFTSADLEAFPDDGKRYEIIDGELYVSKQPHAYHQLVCFNVASKLKESGSGQAFIAPGLI